MPDFSDLLEEPSVRRVLYVGAALLIAVPFVQAGSQLWPLQLTNIQWRFGAANALSSVLLLPYLGLSLLFIMARGTESRGLSLAVGVISAIFAVGLGASLVLFALDALQLKAIVNSQMLATFKSTSVRVGAVSGLFLVAFTIMAFASLKAPKGSKAAKAQKGDKKGEERVGLVVGQ